MKKEKFTVGGMSCSACEARVNKAVINTPGVISCFVSLLTNSMEVSYDENITSSAQIITSVEKAGYKANVFIEENLKNKYEKDEETKRLLFLLIISLIILVPLFYLSMGYMMNWYIFGLENHLIILGCIELVLSLSILVINNRYFISGTKALFHGGPNMDTLVMLGSGVSFIYSLVLFVLMCVNYQNDELVMHYAMNLAFETSGMVPTLISVGKTLESYSKGKTTSAIKSLINLMPKKAHLINGEDIIDVDPNEINIDDELLIKPDESFPVDGLIIVGETDVNESMLTGESLPINKVVGDEVKSGTINLTSTLHVKATKVGKETTLSQIIKMVEDASSSKAKISKIADKVASIFVPSVILISIIIFVFWMIFGQDFVTNNLGIHNTLLSYSLDRAISVLVISCPCSLGLATPVAIMVGNGKAARNGILFKNAEALEEVNKAKFIVLDKTGTITEGSPEIDKMYYEDDDFLNIVYSLEFLSNHPLAVPFIKMGQEKNLTLQKVSNFLSLTGNGLSGEINNSSYLIVNENYILKNNIDFSYTKELKELKAKGDTTIIVLKDGVSYGLIGVSDKIKDDSKDAIKELYDLGLEVVMLTGDNEKSAKKVALEVGINKYVYEVLPSDKLDIIERLQEHGSTIMVGDGINDAPALSKANVGVSIKKGSDIAIDSSSVILLKNTLMDAVRMIKISRATVRNIKENLFWAFFYNIIMIPIAAGVFSPLGLFSLKPWMSALAMSLSSVTVVINALRLNLIKLDKKSKPRKNKININEIDLNINRKEDKKVEKTILIEGMMCNHCVSHVEKALRNIEGIENVNVSLLDKKAVISSSKNIDNQVINKAIQEAGYEVKEIN